MKNWVWLIGIYTKIALCLTPISPPVQPWFYSQNPLWLRYSTHPSSTTFCNFRNFYSLPNLGDFSLVYQYPHSLTKYQPISAIEAYYRYSPYLKYSQFLYNISLPVSPKINVLSSIGWQNSQIPREYNSSPSHSASPMIRLGICSGQESYQTSAHGNTKIIQTAWISYGDKMSQLQDTFVANHPALFPSSWPFSLDYQLGFIAPNIKIPVYLTFHGQHNNNALTCNLLLAISAAKHQYMQLVFSASTHPLGAYYLHFGKTGLLKIGGMWHPQLGISPSISWVYQTLNAH